MTLEKYLIGFSGKKSNQNPKVSLNCYIYLIFSSVVNILLSSDVNVLYLIWLVVVDIKSFYYWSLVCLLFTKVLFKNYNVISFGLLRLWFSDNIKESNIILKQILSYSKIILLIFIAKILYKLICLSVCLSICIL